MLPPPPRSKTSIWMASLSFRGARNRVDDSEHRIKYPPGPLMEMEDEELWT